MSTQQQIDALARERSHNRTLRLTVLAVAALGALGMVLTWSVPKEIDLHVAPDMRAGETVRVEDGRSAVPPTNVYGFAYYIWQQVNRWQADGAKDYGQQIFRFQSYITPSCRAQLQADMQSRFKSGELRQRTRQIAEIPGLGYAPNRVLADGRAAWTVLLDMQLMETFRGQPVKDTYIRYPIRVVRYDVDRERNPWRLAIDCYGTKRPARIAAADVEAIAAGKAEADLPSAIAPPVLPGVSDESVDPNAAPAVPGSQAPAAPAVAPAAPAAPAAATKNAS